MIFEISCWILEKKSLDFHLLKTVIFGNFRFWAKNILKVVKQTVKIIKIAYFFDVDLFSLTFDMELLNCAMKHMIFSKSAKFDTRKNKTKNIYHVQDFFSIILFGDKIYFKTITNFRITKF